MSKIAANLAVIEKRLARLQSQLGPLQERVKGLTQKINDFSDQLKEWSGEAEAARKDIETVSGSLAPIRSLLASTKAAGKHVSAEQAEARQTRESMQAMFGDALQVVSRFIETAQKVGLLDREKAAELLHITPIPAPVESTVEPVPAPAEDPIPVSVEPVVESAPAPAEDPIPASVEPVVEPAPAPAEDPILPKAGPSEAEIRETSVPVESAAESVPAFPEEPTEPEEIFNETASIEEDSIEAAAVEETPELVDELVADLQTPSPDTPPIEPTAAPPDPDLPKQAPAALFQDVHPVGLGSPISRPDNLPPHLSEQEPEPEQEQEPAWNGGPEPGAVAPSTAEIAGELDLSPLRLDTPPEDVPEVDDETEDAIEAMLANMSKPITT